MSDSVNPNVEVGAEATITSKSNSSISFDELDQLDDQPKAKKPPAEKKAEPKEKAEPKKSESKPVAKKAEADAEDDDEEPKAKESGAAVKKGGEDDKPASKEDEEKAKKPRSYKFKVGEETHAIPADHPVPVQVNGKKEDVPLQELINSYSGKVHYDREFSKLDVERKAHVQQVEQMNTMVKDLYERASKNPEDAYDFLAELTNKDPIELKEQILRSQWDAMRHLAELPEEEREEWFKDQVRTWKDRRYATRDEAEKKKRDDNAKAQHLAQVRDHFGIDEEAYGEAERVAAKYLNGEKPTPQQVIYADRYMTALDAVKEAVPHLEHHKNFGSIVEDIVQEMLRHPKLYGKERLHTLLRETFPAAGDETLEKLAGKVKKAADIDGEEQPKSRQSARKSEAVTFDDLD
jgi:hypothetical protein